MLLFRTPQVAVEREGIPIQIVKGELTRPPRGITDAAGTALDAAFPVFVEECVRVLHEKPQANRAHLVLELKLHVQLDCVAPKPHIIRWIGFVPKRELKAKSPGVELDGAFDVACAQNWVRHFEHRKIPICKRRRVKRPDDSRLGDSRSRSLHACLSTVVKSGVGQIVKLESCLAQSEKSGHLLGKLLIGKEGGYVGVQSSANRVATKLHRAKPEAASQRMAASGGEGEEDGGDNSSTFGNIRIVVGRVLQSGQE